MHPIITRDPVSGSELIVTRLESPQSGIVIEGRFSLGWIGRLSREQLDFVDIATRPVTHLELARLALERRIPAICQKPMAATWEPSRPRPMAPRTFPRRPSPIVVCQRPRRVACSS